MANFKPSKYQSAIYDRVKNESCNIVVDAKAGSGKTTTLKGIVELLPAHLRVLVVAFNKSIQKELAEKLPSVEVRTCHSLGMKILSSKQRPKVENDKMRLLIDYFVEKHWTDLAQLDDEEYQDYLSNLRKLADLARQNMVHTVSEIEAVALKHDITLVGDEAKRLINVLRTSARRRDVIDFTDMIYLPALFNYQYPKYDVVLVDECQDLSIAQQTLVKKVIKQNGRFVAVGDPAQAIYGFAGADSESFAKLQQTPNTVTMPLNECYRCGKEIIKYVNAIEPNIEAFPGNGDGEVRDGSVNEIEDGDFVLCRNTLPLVKLCYKFIGEGKAAYVKGRDVGKSLINLIKKSKKNTLPALTNWLDHNLAKHMQKLAKLKPHLESSEIMELSSYVMQEEKTNIIKLIIAENGEVVDIATLIGKIEKIFTEQKKGGICLSTVHKAKGLEAGRVFIVDRHLMPSKFAKKDWQKEQERNIEYVAYTRAKDSLVFVTDWTARDDEQESPVNFDPAQKQEGAPEDQF